MSKVFSYLKPYRWSMIIAWALMLIELIVELWHPLFMAKIIDDGINQGDLAVVLKWGGVMVGMSFIAFIAGITNSFFAAYAGQSFGYDVRSALFKKIQAFSFSNLSRFPTSSLITRMTNDVTQVQNAVFMSLRIMLRAPLLVFGAAIMALFVHVKLALFLVGLIPFLVLFLIWMMKKGGQLFRTVQEKLDQVNNVIQENLAGIKLIRAFTNREHEGARFKKANEQLRDHTIKTLRIIESTIPILLFVMNMGIIVVLWFGSLEIKTNQIQMGQLVAIINYGFRMTMALSLLTFIIMAFSRARASAQRISEVLTTEVDLADKPIEEKDVVPLDDHIAKPYGEMKEQNHNRESREGEILFDQVFFHYPGESTPILKDISFVIKPGETVALLGATGSGKSSLFQLIPRLYDVSSGRILINGIDIQTMQLSGLRKQIGFVPQETILFTGTIKQNISWGKEDASMDEIIEAAESAQIHNTILQLPDQYETKIGQKGVNLSGGQKQRIAIARALVRKPKFLLFDDSTSALDLQTEGKLLHALSKYNCTIFIITQKIGTAKAADRIFLLDEGELIASGNHEELLQRSTLYRRIYQSQFGEEGGTYAQESNYA